MPKSNFTKEISYTTEFTVNQMTHYFEAGVVIVVNTKLNNLVMAVNGVVKDRMCTSDMNIDEYTAYVKNIALEAHKMSFSRS